MPSIPTAAARRLVANRQLSALVAANGLSSTGDWLYLTLLPLLVYRETGDPILVGLIGAARLLPWLLLSIPAGALVDRFPGPRLLVATEAARAALMFLMAALLMADAPFALILGGSLAAVIAGTVAMPAHGRLVPLVAGSDEALQAANVAGATLDNVACVVGPAIAVIVAVLGGIELAFVLNGASFLVVLAVLLRLPCPVARPAWANVIQDAPAPGADGVLAIARSAAARLTLDAAVSFASGALWVLPVLIATEALATGDSVVGVLCAGGGVGGIAGGLLAGRFIDGRRQRGMRIGLCLIAVGIAIIPVGSTFVIALVAMSIASGALVTVDTLNMTELQTGTPPDRLGRTLGILHTSAAASAMAGAALPGFALASLGIGPACLLTALIVGVTGALALAGPRIGIVAVAFWGWLPMFRRSPEPIISA